MKNNQVIPLILGVSFAAILFLFWIIYKVSIVISLDLSWMPSFNAAMNASSAICLSMGLLAIRSGSPERHSRWMMSAFAFSFLFLVGYIAYHSFHGDTLFLRMGLIRWVYFSILISHILSTFFGLPLILITGYFAMTRQFEWHKKLARFTFPIWMYMSVTGVILFCFLRWLNV